MNRLIGILSAGFALIVWGVTFASTRALLTDFSAFEIQVLRFVLAWLVLVAISVVSGEKLRWQGRREWLFAAMGLTGIFIYQFLENCAIYYTNASNVAILVSFGPIVTAVFARLFTRDRSLSPSVVIGSLTAIAGVALVNVNGLMDLSMRPLGNVLALGAMTSWGVYSVLVDRANALRFKPLSVIRKAFGWALLLMVPLALWGATESGSRLLDGSFRLGLFSAENAARFGRPMNWLNLAFLGVLASALSFIAWSRACAVLGVVRTTICLYLEPLIGVGFAALFLGERPTLMNAIGGIVIILGVATANHHSG